jgi:hypothetical protein
MPESASASGASSKASGKFSYPGTPLHGLVTVGIADDLRACLLCSLLLSVAGDVSRAVL